MMWKKRELKPSTDTYKNYLLDVSAHPKRNDILLEITKTISVMSRKDGSPLSSRNMALSFAVDKEDLLNGIQEVVEGGVIDNKAEIASLKDKLANYDANLRKYGIDDLQDLKRISGQLAELKDKLHRRNMQIKDLKKCPACDNTNIIKKCSKCSHSW